MAKDRPAQTPRRRRKGVTTVTPSGDPNPIQAQPVGISLPPPTPLPPELATDDEPVDDPPTNPSMTGKIQLAGAPPDSLDGKIESVEPANGAGPRLSLSGSARKPLARPPPIHDDDDLDEIAFSLAPPVPQVPPEESRPAPTPVDVTLDSIDETPPTVPSPDPTPIPVASQLDDMLGPAPTAPKEISMSPTSPVPPAADKKPLAWVYAFTGVVAVLGVLVVVGKIDPSSTSLWPIGGETTDPADLPVADDVASTDAADREPADQIADTEASNTPSRADEAPETVAKIDPVPDPAELWANRPHPEAFPLPKGTELVGNPPVPTKVAPVEPPPAAKPVAAVVPPTPVAAAPKPVVATVAKPTAPPPAPKVVLPESLTVSATGLKPACKAACTWANVDPKDGFPYTVNGKRDIACGDVTYSIAKWTKIAEGKERFCFTATGLSEEPAGP